MRKLIRWLLKGSAGLVALGFVGILVKAMALRASYAETANGFQTSAYGFGQMLVLIPITAVVMLVVGLLVYLSRKV